MRDNNDNNIDDNIEQLGFLGLYSHLENQQTQNENQRKQNQDLRSIKSSLAEEQRARKAEEKRSKSLPQCPWCGGRLEGKFPKCQNCASDLSWVQGVPCQPGKEAEVVKLLDDKRRREEEEQRQFEKLRQEWQQAEQGVPVRCPKCSRSRPQSSFLTEYVRIKKHWQEKKRRFVDEINSLKTNGWCTECERRNLQRPATEAAEQKEALKHVISFVGGLATGFIMGLIFSSIAGESSLRADPAAEMWMWVVAFLIGVPAGWTITYCSLTDTSLGDIIINPMVQQTQQRTHQRDKQLQPKEEQKMSRQHTYTCIYCRHAGRVSTKRLGERMSCPECNETFTIPMDAPPVAPAS